MPTTKEDILYCKTQRLPEIFLGLSKSSAQEYVAKMYQHPDYADGVIKPTQKMTLVKVDRFEDWLKHMEGKVFE